MVTEKFTSAKPLVNVGTLGHLDHGKSTLTSAITKVLSESGETSYEEYGTISNAPEENVDGVMISVSRVEYETANRRYSHVDCPGRADYMKGMVAGALPMDGAILVVSGRVGPMPQTREQILFARQIGLPALVVFINKVDEVGDEELLEFVESEIRGLLSFYGFPGNDIPVIKGSALAALKGSDDEIGKKAIIDLMAAVDEYVPTPALPKDRPFLMPIEEVVSMSGRGTVATGCIETGIVKVNEEVEIVGSVPSFKATVIGVDAFNETIIEAEAGEKIASLLQGVAREDFQRGQVLARVGSVKSYATFGAAIYMLTKEEGGRQTPFFSGYNPQFLFRVEGITGSIELPHGTQKVMPGDDLQVTVTLIEPTAMAEGLHFTICEGGRNVGKGVVGSIIR